MSDAPVRKAKVPRPASSYRGARRNACLRGEGGRKAKWPGVQARYIPTVIKPPVARHRISQTGLPITVMVERKQPDLHPYASKRQRDRWAGRPRRTA